MQASPANVLTVNVGSSSLKLSLCPLGSSNPRRGVFEKIGSDACEWHLEDEEGRSHSGNGKVSRAADTLDVIEPWIGETRLSGIAHRVVHGGPSLTRHSIITDDVVGELQRASSLAPEHLPGELEMIAALQKRYPDVRQVACFDTAFHTTLPEAASTFALPRKIRDAGVRRYGFHGLSYEYLVGWLRDRGLVKGRAVLAHLGNGASMAAVLDGRSLDTTMGFTPAGGLVMGTRSGDLDPGILRFLSEELGLSAPEIDRQINHESGLKGLFERPADMRDLLAAKATDPQAALALEVFVHQAKKHLCAMAGVLGGLDRLIFTGGIGEHAPEIRAGIVSGLEFIGLRLDLGANAENRTLISSSDSQASVHVIPADEEAAMFHITTDLLQLPIKS
jgi:acetate kinase